MKALIFIILLITNLAQAKTVTILRVHKGAPVVIAIIDTGIGFTQLSARAKLCKFGHKDFTGSDMVAKGYKTVDPVPFDTHGHGTNIAGIIDLAAKSSGIDYCLVIIKDYPSKNPLKSEIEALQYASDIGANIVNISAGGQEESLEETKSVKSLLDKGAILVAAAGNDRNELTPTKRRYFPAQCDPRVIVVGNMSKNLSRSPTSNYGSSVTRWEYGENVEGFGLTMTGTSQATAVATGKLLTEVKIIYDRTKKIVALGK